MARITLENVRIAFPTLWTPEAPPNQPTASPSYSCKFLIEPGSKNDKVIRAAIKAAAEAKFKGRAEDSLEEIKTNKNRMCYVDGKRFKKDGKIYNGFDGMMALTAKRKGTDTPPLALARDNSPASQSSGILYSGCYVDAVVEPFAYTTPGDGISCGLLTVRFRAPGESFGGSGAPTLEGLPPIEDAGFNEDDDAPF